MNTAVTWQTVSTSSGATEKLAAVLGTNLKGGEVIELVSDLGGGKTTFVRGLARGLGSHAHVSSPTFKLSNEYPGAKLKLYHFDFYRLGEAGIMADELAEVVGQAGGVVVVEWGDVVQDVLPVQRLTIKLVATGENIRQLEFRYPEALTYALEGLA